MATTQDRDYTVTDVHGDMWRYRAYKVDGGYEVYRIGADEAWGAFGVAEAQCLLVTADDEAEAIATASTAESSCWG